MPQWESYEQVGTYLLDQFAAEFGLDRVKAKQEVPGQRSGTSWEIDAKGVTEDGKGFFIVECRRYTTSKQNQGRRRYGADGGQDHPLHARGVCQRGAVAFSPSNTPRLVNALRNGRADAVPSRRHQPQALSEAARCMH